MAYILQYEVTVAWIPDGGGPMTQPTAQKMVFRPQPGPSITASTTLMGGVGGLTGTVTQGGWPIGPGPVGIVVPGLDAPTQANFRSALHGATTQPTGGASGSMAGDVDAQIATNLALIQNWAKGGG